MTGKNPPKGSREDLVEQVELGPRARAALRRENTGSAGTRQRVYARASRAVRLARGRQQ